MRTTTCRSNWLATLVAGAVLAPATALAQPTPAAAAAPSAAAVTDSARHVVQRGETLWGLAARYLSDPYRWTALHELNRDVVADPHWIYPGERLRIPGAAPADASAVASAGIGAGVGAGVGAGMDAGDGSTIFTRSEQPAVIGGFGVQAAGTPAAPAAGGLLQADSLRALRRLADYTAAPYLSERGGPAGAGRMLQLPTRLRASAVGEEWVQLGSEVRVELPAGVLPALGQRYVVYGVRHDLGRANPIVEPTGVVELSRLDSPLPRAKVIAVLGKLVSGQAILPLATPAPATGGTASGASTRVIWVQDGAVLPSEFDWVLLAPPSGGGMAEGDVVEFVRSYRPDGADRGPELEEVVARAQVVRVTAGAASALITEIVKPVLDVGSVGRVASRRD